MNRLLELGYSSGLIIYYTLLGTFALFVAFKLFDRVITKIDIEEEIRKGNTAAAILAASIILGISAIVAVCIHG